jgi:hypothetical protein
MPPMTAQIQDFDGVLTPREPATFSVRCVTCGETVLTGMHGVDTHDIQHECEETTSEVEEYEVTWSPLVRAGEGA